MKNFNLKSVLFYTCLWLVISCSSIKNKLIPTDNKGGYKISSVEENKTNSSLKEIIIYGKVMGVSTGQPINNAQLTLGCLKTRS